MEEHYQSEQHQGTIHRTPEVNSSVGYPFSIVCTCNWRAFAGTEEIAERLLQNHLRARDTLALNKGMPYGTQHR